MEDISQELKDMARIMGIAQRMAEVITTNESMLEEAIQQIEKLREALKAIVDIYYNPGRYTEFHRYQRRGLEYEWPALCRAIEKAARLTGHGKE